MLFYKDLYTEEHLRQLGLNERQVQAVRLAVQVKEIAIVDFRRLVPNVSEKTLYRDLQNLVERGIFRREGGKKDSHYLLK